MKSFFLYIFLVAIATFSCQKKELVPLAHKKNNQSICINFIYTPLSLDPRKHTDPVTKALSFMLYEGLTRLEPDGTLSMAVAEQVDISKDKKSYTFHLKKKCMWSDGTALTAHDFEASWKNLLHPNFPSRSASLLFAIKNAERAKQGQCSLEQIGVKAINDTQLYVELTKPTPYFLELTAFCTYFPVPSYRKVVSHPSQGQTKVFNGPFILKSWVENSTLMVQKNPYYWNKQMVGLDEIQIMIINDEATAFHMYEQGYIDWIGGAISPLPLDVIHNRSNVQKCPIAGTTISTFNTLSYPFNNVNIRKAFAYSINRKDIVNNITIFDEIATGPVPHILKNSTQTLFTDHSEELAKQYFNLGLQELGITQKDLPTIIYHYFTSELQRNLALYLQSVWKKVLGVEVQIKCHELKTHLTKLRNRDFQIAQMSWIGHYHDRMSFLNRFYTKNGFCNYSSWENAHYNQLIEQSFYKKSQERNILLEHAEKIIINEMPIIPICHHHLVYIQNIQLKNVMISPLGDIQFHKAFLKQEKISS